MEIHRLTWERAMALLVIAASVGVVSGCAGDRGAAVKIPGLTQKSCGHDPRLDSGATTVISSWNHGGASYGQVVSRWDSGGRPVVVRYMYHPARGQARALLVLFAGGDGTTGIRTDNARHLVGSGRNFLVRSAHLFARQGYDVVTIARPSDERPDFHGARFDTYRVSMRAAVDISAVIRATDLARLPVVLVGTSRGAISAVANSMLGSGIALSSPVTTGGGAPIGGTWSPAQVQPAHVDVPVQVSWSVRDHCEYSRPDDSRALAGAFARAGVPIAAVAIHGGFSDRGNTCGPLSHHGYLGIESCSVGVETQWMARVILTAAAHHGAPTARPVVRSEEMVAGGGARHFSLAPDVSDAHGDRLHFSVPYPTTSLGGTVAIDAAGEVAYTPPSSLGAKTRDTFVYVVTDGRGGRANNVVGVALAPVKAGPN